VGEAVLVSFLTDLDLLSRSDTLGRHVSGNEGLRLASLLSALTLFDDPRTLDSFSTPFVCSALGEREEGVEEDSVSGGVTEHFRLSFEGGVACLSDFEALVVESVLTRELGSAGQCLGGGSAGEGEGVFVSFLADLDLLSRLDTLGKQDFGNEGLRLGGVLSALTFSDDSRTSDFFPTPLGTELFSDSGISFSEGVGALDSSESVFVWDCSEGLFGSEPAAHVSGEMSDSTCAESVAEMVSGDVSWECAGREGLTDSCALGDNMLGVTVELESFWVTLEDMDSDEVEEIARLDEEGLGLICEPVTGRICSEDELWPDGSEEMLVSN